MTEASFNAIIEKLNLMITESRNHHEILYYHLEDSIKLLAEGQVITNENLERFKEYTTKRFNHLDKNVNTLILQDSPSGAEFRIIKKQVQELSAKVFK
jgi:hypothetical protein